MVSNVDILLSIVSESHKHMNDLLEKGRTAKEGGGYILHNDPEHRSFKEALKVLMFVGASIEAMWYQKAVELNGKACTEKMDDKSRGVAKKLQSLGVVNEKLLGAVRNYYRVRRQIVHEKAYENSYQESIFVAQTEANKAVEMLECVKVQLEALND